MTNDILKFTQISGLCGRTNDLLLFSKKNLADTTKLVVFFHGDIQNYENEMIKHNETKQFVEWNLERTIKLIGDKFEDSAILLIKSCDMYMNQYARYFNFIDYKNELVNYRNDFDALQHLEQLILNLKKEIQFNSDYQHVEFRIDDIKDLILIGFSSGGSILNQIMISLNELKNDLDSAKCKQSLSIDQLSDEHCDGRDNNLDNLSCSMSSSLYSSINRSRLGLTNSLSTSFTDNKIFYDILNTAVNSRLNLFYKKLKKLIWLDLGLNVVDDQVYILDNQILQNIIELEIEIQVHSTPRQINCPYRPFIGEQEKKFCKKFENYDHFKRKLYLDRSPTLQNHFKILEDFDPS